jgi:hypothetical protein
MLTNRTYTFTITNLSSHYKATPHFGETIEGNKILEPAHYFYRAYMTGTISPNNATLGFLSYT